MDDFDRSNRLHIWELVRAGLILGEMSGVTRTTKCLQLGMVGVPVADAVQELRHIFKRLELTLSEQLVERFEREVLREKDESLPPRGVSDLAAALILTVEAEATNPNRSVFVLSPDPEIEKLLNEPRPRFGVDPSHPLDPGNDRDMYGAIRCLALGQYEATAYFGLRNGERYVQSCYRLLTGEEPRRHPSAWTQLIRILEKDCELTEILKILREERNGIMHPEGAAEPPQWNLDRTDELLNRLAASIHLMMGEVDRRSASVQGNDPGRELGPPSRRSPTKDGESRS